MSVNRVWIATCIPKYNFTSFFLIDYAKRSTNKIEWKTRIGAEWDTGLPRGKNNLRHDKWRKGRRWTIERVCWFHSQELEMECNRSLKWPWTGLYPFDHCCNWTGTGTTFLFLFLPFHFLFLFSFSLHSSWLRIMCCRDWHTISDFLEQSKCLQTNLHRFIFRVQYDMSDRKLQISAISKHLNC